MELVTFKETFVFSIGAVLGVWGVGSIFKESTTGGSLGRHLMRLLNPLMGSSFGALLVIQIDTINIHDDFLFPLAGAIFGYYFPNLFQAKPHAKP